MHSTYESDLQDVESQAASRSVAKLPSRVLQAFIEHWTTAIVESEVVELIVLVD